VERDEVPKFQNLFFTNLWVGWVVQSNWEWNSIIYNIDSFSL